MKPQMFEERILGHVGSFPITSTMVSGLAVTSVLLAGAAVLGRRVLHRPATRSAAVARIVVRFLQNVVSRAAGRESPWLEVFAGSLFLFIAGSALAGQLPVVVAPTANLGVTSALAILVFLAVPIAGIAARGPTAYLKRYFAPNPIFFPLHLISEISRTFALALRLFGNMLSGELVVGLIVALVGLVLPVPLMALDLLIGILQAYIFTVLASVYIGAAIRVGEGEGHERSHAPRVRIDRHGGAHDGARRARRGVR